MSLSSSVSLAILASLVGAPDVGALGYTVDQHPQLQWASGTGVGKADLLFTDTRTLAASATEDLDLAGVLVDALGATLTFAKVKAIIVVAAAGNTNDVVVGGAASNGFNTPFSGTTPAVKVRPGGVFMLAADSGYAVTNSTADILKMTNGGGTTGVTYTIYIIGASA